MTAPAEDPRGGEGHNHVTRDIKPVGKCPACDEYWGTNWGNPRPPAAGRGDTDSGGEQVYASAHERLVAEGKVTAETLTLDDVGDRAQPTEELREAVAGWLFDFSMRRIQSDLRWAGDLGVRDEGGIELLREATVRAAWRSEADRLLAGPLAALLDAQAKVERVGALAKEYADRSETVADGFWKRHLWIVSQRLHRALGGTA